MRSRTIAIAGSIAALSFAATPIAAVAATTHHTAASAARIDRSRDSRDVRHVDKTPRHLAGHQQRGQPAGPLMTRPAAVGTRQACPPQGGPTTCVRSSLGRDRRLRRFPGSTRRDATDNASGVRCEAGSVNSAHAPVIPRPGELPGQARHPRGHKLAWLLEHRAQILASIAVTAIAIGGVLYLLGAGDAGQAVWGAAVALLAAELTFEVVRTVITEHSLGVDTIALIAMLGALALGQELAGAVIGLMFTGGASLEAVALPACASRADGARPARSEGRAAAGR